MRKKLWICAAAGLLLFACSAREPCVTVTEQTFCQGSATLVEDICTPIVSGFGSRLFEDALNAHIQAFVQLKRNDAREQAAQAQQWGAYVCVLTIDYELKNTCGLFSMRITSDLENGGTGFPKTVYINADITQNCLLGLDDLFISSGYRSVIAAGMREIVRGDERFSPEQISIDANTAFFISDGRLFIAFDKYEIASGAAGEPVLEVPKTLIIKYIKPAYWQQFGIKP